MITVDEQGEGQRVDNFVLRFFPAVPKTRLYRALRKGEVRVNKGRVRADQRLRLGDVVRLPPLAAPEKRASKAAPPGWQQRLADSVVLEDDDLLIVDKPSGLAVHGGSGLQFGLIETLREIRGDLRFLELVHRLDRDTSGLLLVAKRPAALRALHDLLRRREAVSKHYLALVAGSWPRAVTEVEAPLLRIERPGGERWVQVAKGGKPSLTRFRIRDRLAACTLLEAQPVTGRTHQIRVHALHAGHPLLGDERYAHAEALSLTRRLGLRRLFLHAERLQFTLNGRHYDVQAPPDSELSGVIARARQSRRTVDPDQQP